jgi:hypothetical protein
MDSFPGYPYVLRVLPLPVEFAQVGFDVVCRRLAGASVAAQGPQGDRSECWRVQGPSGCLDLAAPAVATAPVAGYGSWRKADGTLRTGRCLGLRVPVEVALLPWSGTRSELGLTALSRTWSPPGPRRVRAYLIAAHHLLDVLAGAIDDALWQWTDEFPWQPPVPMRTVT